MAKEVVIAGVKVAKTLHGDYVLILTDTSGRPKVALDVDNVGLATKANQAIQLARDVTWVRKYDKVSAGSVIIHTVTTGKTFYLVYALVEAWHYAAGVHEGYLIVRDTADVLKGFLLKCGGPDADDRFQQNASFPIPLAIPAGWDIVLGANLNSTARASIYGWEE